MRIAIISISACAVSFSLLAVAQQPQSDRPAQERHLTNIRQLTHGGENAEAYFSPDGSRLVFQSTREGVPCDQIFTMNVDGSNKKQLSRGGRTTCGYFFPDGKSIVYASTHLGSAECPPRPSYARGYVWPVTPYRRSNPIFAATRRPRP